MPLIVFTRLQLLPHRAGCSPGAQIPWVGPHPKDEDGGVMRSVADRDCSQDLGLGSAGANGQPGQNARPCLWPQPRAPRVMPWSRGCLNRPSSPPDRWWARGAGPAAELGFSVCQHGWFNGLKFAGPPVTGTYTGPSAWITDTLPPSHAHLATPPHRARAAIITTNSRGTGAPASVSGLVGAWAGCPAPWPLSLPPESKC